MISTTDGLELVNGQTGAWTSAGIRLHRGGCVLCHLEADPRKLLAGRAVGLRLTHGTRSAATENKRHSVRRHVINAALPRTQPLCMHSCVARSARGQLTGLPPPPPSSPCCSPSCRISLGRSSLLSCGTKRPQGHRICKGRARGVRGGGVHHSPLGRSSCALKRFRHIQHAMKTTSARFPRYTCYTQQSHMLDSTTRVCTLKVCCARGSIPSGSW